MAKQLKIPGRPEDASAKRAELNEDTVDLPLEIAVQKVVDVPRARAAGEAVTVSLEPFSEHAGQLCEVELEGGIKLWMRVSSFYRDFGIPRTRGVAPAPTDEVWEIAPHLIRPVASRGELQDNPIRRVTIFHWQRKEAGPLAEPAPEGDSRGIITDTLVDAVGDKVAEIVAGRVASRVGRKVESRQLGGEPGLYWQDLSAGLDRFQTKTGFEGEEPFLLFLHGTMSSFKGSFGELWSASASAAEARQQLARRYGGAYAWEHYTLTESPIDNALALAEKLPDKARLHLVSHSRGGLIGELLCLGKLLTGQEPLSPGAVDLFKMAAAVGELADADNPYQQQAARLGALIELLEKKAIQVERFVRVACPSRGTTLASNRLDRWLSVFKLLGDLASPLKLPLQLILALIAEHDDPSTLPGLEAMKPGSPLIRLLNFPDLKVQADLSVISGDTEGSGLLERLKEFALDRFFEDESDIIVNTGAMYGGLRRAEEGRFFLDRGAEVNHFNYFDNPETAALLVAGLLRADTASGGFQSLSAAEQKEPARAARPRAPKPPRPVVFLLPGIMGSHLKVNGNRIWLDLKDLMLGRIGRLAADAQGVSTDGLLEDFYGELGEYLENTHEVILFSYDWRRSILEAGRDLARQISAKLDQRSNLPVQILAHSMGGLVARALLAQERAVWQRMTAHPDSRLLMLGTPNGGSYEILSLLTGRAKIVQQLELLDLTRGTRGLLEIIARLPGVLELLPTDEDLRCFQADYWTALRRLDQDNRRFPWTVPAAADLQQARQTWRVLQAGGVDTARTLYIAGCAPATPIAWREATEFDYDPEPRPWKTIVFEATRRGDGKVPWDTGIPHGVKTWYLEEAEHGDLPCHAAAFPAYLELLQTGTTSRLSATPPATLRAGAMEQRFDLPPQLPDRLPDERDLGASALGASPRRVRPKPRLPKVELSVTHGDLAYGRYAVAVGHYQGDTIVSAENYLDKALGGRLRKRHRLGLYPGRLGSCEVFLNSDPHARPGGAIVIGLGQVGELSPGSLESGFAQAALSYALQVEECLEKTAGHTSPRVPRSAHITALLIGTGAGGITVQDSIGAILRGVATANRRLQELKPGDAVWIDSLEFLELWQDIALQAADALERILMDGELKELFDWKTRVIREGQGGRCRLQFEEPANWWQRLEIIYDQKKEELRFIALTDRARAEETLVAGQWRLADGFIKEAVTDTRYNQAVSRTLFEMLLPNRLKEMAPNRYNVVLVLDEISGAYPWELLEDRWGNGNKPFAVAAGVLRQFKTGAFRERPVTLFQDTAYVVGNPKLPPLRADFPFLELQGAQSEAIAVAEFLRKRGFKVTEQIHSNARDILTHLHADGYRILHLAGHGVHDWELEEPQQDPCASCGQRLPNRRKRVSGMLIGENLFLAPGEVNQMRWVPELVFINCCHLGRLDAGGVQAPRQRFDQLAANIAAQFIEMGVKAVVAAGWAVDDAAAETFAVSFYGHLLDGNNFGEAVRAAREETFERHSHTNTWGAYQCYGDPAYRLRVRSAQPSQKQPPRYRSAMQLAMDLNNLAHRLRTSGSDSAKEVREEIEQLIQSLSPEQNAWLGRSEVAAALGLVYGELGVFDQAIEHLDQALTANKAEFPVRVLEQRANLKSRWAVAVWRSTGERDKTSELIKQAVDELNSLLNWGTTVERLSLLGSAHKRHAWIAVSDEERKAALQAMADCYEKAHLASEKPDKLDTYPLLNWLAAKLLLAWPGKPNSELAREIQEWGQKAEAQAAERDQQDPDFWNSVVRAECELLRNWAGRALDKNKQAILKSYRLARQRGASPREFRSVLEDLEFLADMTAVSAKGPARKQADALRSILEQLEALLK